MFSFPATDDTTSAVVNAYSVNILVVKGHSIPFRASIFTLAASHPIPEARRVMCWIRRAILQQLLYPRRGSCTGQPDSHILDGTWLGLASYMTIDKRDLLRKILTVRGAAFAVHISALFGDESPGDAVFEIQ